jgi:hypothetical protein
LTVCLGDSEIMVAVMFGDGGFNDIKLGFWLDSIRISGGGLERNLR